MFKFRVYQFKLCSLCRWRKRGLEKINQTCHAEHGKELGRELRSPNHHLSSGPRADDTGFVSVTNERSPKHSSSDPRVPRLTFSPFCINSGATWTVHSHLAGRTSTTFDKWISSQQCRLNLAASECHVFRWVNNGTGTAISCNSRKVWEVLCVKSVRF